jgi:acyl CoA:acetate/3-ketoacid CoA transferase alpha subunit
MRPGRWGSLSEVVASIPDGAWLATGGFMLGRAPMALVLELIAQGRKDLKLISLPNPLPVTPLPDARTVSAIRAIDSRGLRDQLVGA